MVDDLPLIPGTLARGRVFCAHDQALIRTRPAEIDDGDPFVRSRVSGCCATEVLR